MTCADARHQSMKKKLKRQETVIAEKPKTALGALFRNVLRHSNLMP